MCYDLHRRAYTTDEEKRVEFKDFIVQSNGWPIGSCIFSLAMRYIDEQDDVIEVCELLEIISVVYVGQFISN